MDKQAPQYEKEAMERLGERLTALKTPPMPPGMEERVRARLQAETATAEPRPAFWFLPRSVVLSPAQQWALVAALMTLAACLLARQAMPELFWGGVSHCISAQQSGIANAATPLPTVLKAKKTEAVSPHCPSD